MDKDKTRQRRCIRCVRSVALCFWYCYCRSDVISCHRKVFRPISSLRHCRNGVKSRSLPSAAARHIIVHRPQATRGRKLVRDRQVARSRAGTVRAIRSAVPDVQNPSNPSLPQSHEGTLAGLPPSRFRARRSAHPSAATLCSQSR